MSKTFTTRSMHGTTTYEVVQHRENCYYAKGVSYVPNYPYTPQEQRLHELADEKYEANAEYFAAHAPEPHFDCYTTAEAAQRAVELLDAMNSIDDDLQAFGAPSECQPLAMRTSWRELEELDAKFGTRMNPPTLGEQYAERGLPDPTRPIRESLPAGMCDDRDVIMALGERSAL